MEGLITITPKFQFHLPAKIRKAAGITTHGRAKISATKGKIVISMIEDEIGPLAGKFTVKKSIPLEKMRDYIDYSKW
jgi:bifunctional DNA-binding transcriptional regulator/antitoxin component of YhaV-PrlF toxin-antitoxin module